MRILQSVNENEEPNLGGMASVLLSQSDCNGKYSEDDKESPEDFVPIPPDGGWGWIIMICSLLNNFIVDGIPNAFSYLLYEFIDHYEVSHSEGAWVGSLLTGVYLCTGMYFKAYYLVFT